MVIEELGYGEKGSVPLSMSPTMLPLISWNIPTFVMLCCTMVVKEEFDKKFKVRFGFRIEVFQA